MAVRTPRPPLRDVAPRGIGPIAMEIVLVRHGRSAHVHRGWIDRAGFGAWREAYEAAGLARGQAPSPELVRLAEGALVVSSDIRRAVESARLLAPEVETSPLLRELELPAPELGLRMPLAGWALAIGLANFLLERKGGYPQPAEVERVKAAVGWLTGLAREHRTVVAVTHGSLRRELGLGLVARGWQALGRWRSIRPWSAWTFTSQSGG
jgi:broad specificity phosphatase PhoE